MESLGASLRSERVRQGLSLDQIAADLKISTRQLRAIEEGQYWLLPGAVLARNFTRQYAERLGVALPANSPGLREIDQAFDRLGEPPESMYYPRSLGTVQQWERDRWQNSLGKPMLWAAGIALAGYAAFWTYQRLQPNAPQSAPHPSTPVTAGPSATTKAAATPTLPAVSPPGVGELQLELQAGAQCWVRVASGPTVLFAGLLPAGAQKRVSAANSMTVVVGNAGALHLKVNGKELGPAGPAGQRRSLMIDREGMRSLPGSSSRPAVASATGPA